MISKAEMAKGMALLSTAFNRELTREVIELYQAVIGPRLDAQAWEHAVKQSLSRETFFPPPAVLLSYGLSEGAPLTRAVTVYEQIVREYECGRHLGPREVRDQFGAAAMDSFVAAGGTRAFEWCEPESEPFRRKAFAETWVEVTEQDPSKALPAPEPSRLLGDGDAPVSKAEARRLMAQLAGMSRGVVE